MQCSLIRTNSNRISSSFPRFWPPRQVSQSGLSGDNPMQKFHAVPKFTGEYFVPGKSGHRIQADHVERYKFASKYVSGKSVLDIACGVGYSAPILTNAGAISYDGVDISKELTSYAVDTYGSDFIHYHTGDICSFNNGEQYDLITCFETIEHINNYEQALSNLYKLMKPDGLLFISSPNRVVTSPKCKTLLDKPENEFHTQEFVPDELLAILNKHGFSAKNSDVFGQRQRPRGLLLMRQVSSRLSRRLERIADHWSSPAATAITMHRIPRYFLVIATKKLV